MSTSETTPTTTGWNMDPGHTHATFKVRHMVVSYVRGELGTVSGTMQLDDQQPERSRIDVSIDGRALDSQEFKRDEHHGPIIHHQKIRSRRRAPTAAPARTTMTSTGPSSVSQSRRSRSTAA